MKGLKKLSLIALSLAFVAGLAACTGSKNGNDNNGDKSSEGEGGGEGGGGQVTPPDVDPPYVPPIYVEEKYEYPVPVDQIIQYDQMVSDMGSLSDLDQPENYPGVYINPDNKIADVLMDITICTISTDTTFYLGQEYSPKNTKVIARFKKVDEDGNDARDEAGMPITFYANVTNYCEFVGKDVDTSVLGTYNAQVNFRYGEIVKSKTYTVRVKSSEFETTKGLRYVAGIKAGYVSSAASENFVLKNDGRIAETYLRKNATNDFTLDASQLKIQIVRNTVNTVASAYKTDYLDFDLSTLENDTVNKKLHNADNSMVIDYSRVDTGKVGSYLVPITYNAGIISVKGEDIENKVQAFIAVDVISPVYNCMITSNNISIEASMDLPDFSAYKALITRKVWDTATNTLVNAAIQTPITSDLFIYEGIVSYNQGIQQVKFILKEKAEDGSAFEIAKQVTVTASTKYNINVVKDVSGKTIVSQYQSGTKTYYGEYDFGNGVKAFNVDSTNVTNKQRTCLEDGLVFDGFLGLDSMAKNSYIEVTVTKATKFILYIGSNGDDERGFAVYDSDNKKIYEDVINPSEVGGKQCPKRVVFDFEPGTYKISALGTTMTFHGYVVGTAK